MKRIALVACLAVVGCGKKKAQEGLEPLQPAPVGSGSAEVKPLTAEELGKRFDECWGFWNAGKYDDFKGCYSADATSETPGSGMPNASGAAAVVEATKQWKTALPDQKGEAMLELVDGHNLVAVSLLTGTHTAPLTSPFGDIAPTHKKTGIMVAQALELDDAGHAKHEADYFDAATLLGQLVPTNHPVRAAIDKLPMSKEVVIAKHDDKEKANLDVAKATSDAFNKHDAKAFGGLLTDAAVWSEQPMATDWNKQQTIQHAQDVWKGFSDLKITAVTSWGAGDYVVVLGTMAGTNDGPLPQMGIKAATKKAFTAPFLAIHKIDGGKVKATWVFDQSLALAQQLGLLPAPKPGTGVGSADANTAGGAGSAASATGSAAK